MRPLKGAVNGKSRDRTRVTGSEPSHRSPVGAACPGSWSEAVRLIAGLFRFRPL